MEKTGQAGTGQAGTEEIEFAPEVLKAAISASYEIDAIETYLKCGCITSFYCVEAEIQRRIV